MKQKNNSFKTTRKTNMRLSAWMLGLTTSAMLACSANAAITLDRDYQMGDDDGGKAVGEVVGTDFGGTYYTYDTAGVSGDGDYIDLIVNGSPVYTNGYSSGLAVVFDGVDDHLSGTSMNSPAEMAFRISGYPHDYSNIHRRGMQMWVKPTAVNGTKQTIISDTSQHGIYISENNKWGMKFNATNSETSVDVVQDEWTHVSSRSLFYGRYWNVLHVNGVAVSTSRARYDETVEEDMSIGSELIDGTASEFFTGSIDEVKMHVEGVNTTEHDYGTYSLATDNDYVAKFIADNNVTNVGDVNMDGVLSGDGTGDAATDDIAAFVAGWGSDKIINNVRVGDLETRLRGDLNWDGRVDGQDWFIIRGAYATAGLAIVSVAIPEPTSIALIMLSGAALLKRRAH